MVPELNPFNVAEVQTPQPPPRSDIYTINGRNSDGLRGLEIHYVIDG